MDPFVTWVFLKIPKCVKTSAECRLHLSDTLLRKLFERGKKMWNSVILPILTSLAATGLGILAVWLYNRKRSDDKIANEIARITSKIEAVEAKMDNGFNRENLEKDTLLNAFNTAKTEMEQANEATALKQREFYQDIIERIHAETVAHEGFSRTVKISIDNVEKEVSTNKDLINRILDLLKSHSELIKRALNN